MKKKTRKPPIRETKPRSVPPILRDAPITLERTITGTVIIPSNQTEAHRIRFSIVKRKQSRYFEVVFDPKSGSLRIRSSSEPLVVTPEFSTSIVVK